MIVTGEAQRQAWRARRLTWSRGWAQITGFMRRAALAETAAHIAYLEGAGGLVTRAAGAPGGDRFWIAAPATIGRNG